MVKPDGTPYKLSASHMALMNDWCTNAAGILESLWTRGGGEYTSYDCSFDINKQIAYIEDQVETGNPDAIVMLPVNEAQLGPAVDKAYAAGIPCFAYCFDVYSDNLTSVVLHDFDGPEGTSLLGEYLIDYAEKTGNQVNVFEVWGDMAADSAHERHDGFHNAVDGNPMITVMESADTKWSEETATNYVMDAFTAHSELNAIFVQGGGAAGSVEALRLLDRLVPADDPEHVMLCATDCDVRIMEEMDAGNVEVCATHYSWAVCDGAIKQIIWNVIKGQPVERTVFLPLKVITRDTMRTDDGLYFGTVVGSLMPQAKWDLWPVRDLTAYGIETPMAD